MNSQKVDTSQITKVIVTGEDKKEHTIGVPTKLAQACYDGMQRAIKAWSGISAVREQLAKLEGSADATPQVVRSFGEECIRFANNDLKLAASYFAGGCGFAENRAVQAADPEGKKGVTISRILPNWAQQKSIIAKALKLGINFTETLPEDVTVKGVTYKAGTPKYDTMGAIRAQVAVRGTKERGEGNGAFSADFGWMQLPTADTKAPGRDVLVKLAAVIREIQPADYLKACEVLVTATSSLTTIRNANAADEPVAAAKAAALRGGSKAA
jgi:hypothetical protein